MSPMKDPFAEAMPSAATPRAPPTDAQQPLQPSVENCAAPAPDGGSVVRSESPTSVPPTSEATPASSTTDEPASTASGTAAAAAAPLRTPSTLPASSASDATAASVLPAVLPVPSTSSSQQATAPHSFSFSPDAVEAVRGVEFTPRTKTATAPPPAYVPPPTPPTPVSPRPGVDYNTTDTSTAWYAHLGSLEQERIDRMIREQNRSEKSKVLSAKIAKYTAAKKANNRRWNFATNATVVVSAALFLLQVFTFLLTCLGIAYSGSTPDDLQTAALLLQLIGFAGALTITTVSIFIFKSCGRSQLRRHDEALRGTRLSLSLAMVGSSTAPANHEHHMSRRLSEVLKSTVTLAQLGREDREEVERQIAAAVTAANRSLESDALSVKIAKYTAAKKANSKWWSFATTATIVVSAALFLLQVSTFFLTCLGISYSARTPDGFQVCALVLQFIGFAGALTIMTVNIFIFKSCGRSQLQRHEDIISGATLSLGRVAMGQRSPQQQDQAAAAAKTARVQTPKRSSSSSIATGDSPRKLSDDFFGAQ